MSYLTRAAILATPDQALDHRGFPIIGYTDAGRAIFPVQGGQMLGDVGKLRVLIEGDASGYIRSMSQAGAATSNFEKAVGKGGASYQAFSNRLEKTSQLASRTGSFLTRGVTLPVVALGAAAVKTSMDIETSFASVKKTVDATPAGFAKLSAELRTMAQELIVPVAQLNEIAATAGALGVPTNEIGKFTKAVVQLSIAADDVTFDAAASTLGKLKNVLDLNVTKVRRFTSAIVKLGNKGASTEGEILAMSNRIAGSGRVVGLAAHEIAGFAAALADAGIEAEAGGTAFSRTIEEIATAVRKGTPELSVFAKTAGTSAGDFVKAWKKSPAEAISSFITGLRTLHREGGSVAAVLDALGITERRQRDALQKLAVSQNDVNESLRIANGAYVKNTAAQEEMQKKNETSAKKLEAVKIALQDIAIDVGPPLVDALVKIANVVKSVAERFAKLPKGTQEMIVKALLLAATLGPLLKLVGSFLSMWKLIRDYKAAKSLADGAMAMGSLGTKAGGAIGPVGRLGGLLRGLGGAAAVFAAFDIFGMRAIDTLDGIKRGLNEIASGPTLERAMRAVQLKVTPWDSKQIKGVADSIDLVATSARNSKIAVNEVVEALASGMSRATVEAGIAAGAFDTVGNVKLMGLQREILAVADKFNLSSDTARALAQAAASAGNVSFPTLLQSLGQTLQSLGVSKSKADEVLRALQALNGSSTWTSTIETIHRTRYETGPTRGLEGGGDYNRRTGRSHLGGPIMHKGGLVSMHSGGSWITKANERLVKLQTGEFVMRRWATRAIGVGRLRMMNASGKAGAPAGRGSTRWFGDMPAKGTGTTVVINAGAYVHERDLPGLTQMGLRRIGVRNAGTEIT